MQWKGGGQDGYGKERGSGTEKKRTAVVLSPGNEAERIYPACCNQIREVRVSDTRLMGKRRYASRYAFFSCTKAGKIFIFRLGAWEGITSHDNEE